MPPGQRSSGQKQKPSQRARRLKQEYLCTTGGVEPVLHLSAQMQHRFKRDKLCKQEGEVKQETTVKEECLRKRRTPIVKSEVAQARLGRSLRGRATIGDDAPMSMPVMAESDAEETNYGTECDGVQDVSDAYDSDEFDEDWNKTVSSLMTKVLRYEAYDSYQMDKHGWVSLRDARCSLQRHTLRDVTPTDICHAVQTSDRDNGTARFEMHLCGKLAWVRATGGEYYRRRRGRL